MVILYWVHPSLPLSLQVVLCCVQPTFRVVATLSLAGASELEWAARQLYVLTPTSIYVAFIALPTGEISFGILVCGKCGKCGRHMHLHCIRRPADR